MGNEHSSPKWKLFQPKKTIKGAVLHRINSKRPLIYLNSLEPIDNYKLLQIKRKVLSEARHILFRTHFAAQK